MRIFFRSFILLKNFFIIFNIIKFKFRKEKDFLMPKRIPLNNNEIEFLDGFAAVGH